MIRVGNYDKIKVDHFPDGTQCLMECDVDNFTDSGGYYNIIWNYESDEELVTLIYLVNHIRNKWGFGAPICLWMPYIPNARMDRTKNSCEVFTLKYFTDIINNLHFDHVWVLDPHSDVSVALLDRVSVIKPDDYISITIQLIKDKNHIESDNDIMIYFPDAGAYKRYKDIECLTPYDKIYGQKVRDWKTGKITGLTIMDKDNKNIKKSFEGKYILMIDDIISYGGTMYYSALELSKHNPSKIYAYATHVEPNSLWNPDNGTFIKALGNEVESLYTTNSIYNLSKIDIVIPISLKTPIK